MKRMNLHEQMKKAEQERLAEGEVDDELVFDDDVSDLLSSLELGTFHGCINCEGDPFKFIDELKESVKSDGK